MDTHDSPRSFVPARMPATRPAAALAPRFGAAQPEAAPSPISIRVALRGARRYWWLLLALWTVGSAGLGLVVYMNVKPSYRATSLLRVDPSGQDLYNIRAPGESLDGFLQTQVQLITSPNVLTAAGTNPRAAVLEKIQTAGDVVLELRKAIQVAILPGTYLIEVSMYSPSANEAATLVNAVVDAFIEANVEWSDGMTRNQIKNLETYLGDLKNQTTEMERQWKDLVAKGEGGQIVVNEATSKTKAGAKAGAGETMTNSQISMSVEQLHRLRQQLMEVALELTVVEAWLTTARQTEQAPRDIAASPDQARMEGALKRKLDIDPELHSASSKYRAARAKHTDVLRKTRQTGDPAATLAEKQADEALQAYRTLFAAKKEEFTEILQSHTGVAGDPDRELREKEAQAQVLRVRKAAIESEISKLRIENKKNATDDVEITLIKKHLEDVQAMHETVFRRLEQLRFEARGEARIRPVNAAVPPGKPISDKRMTYLAITPVGILAAVLGLIVLLEIRSGRVADPDLLSSRVRHEVFSIAPLPNIRPGEDVNNDKAEQRLARFVQSLDHLRVALCEGGIPGEGRCVMITSATGGEGKTTLSAHLAARCANAGTSTLLIDADMRRASLGRLLDVPVGIGLGDVLAGEAELEDALTTVQAGGFHFLSAGMPGRDPSRVLKSARLAELIGRLRQTYDIVIIDTPPVLPVADALIMGRWADGAVMAARYDASRLPLVERANRQLAVAGIPVLGVVVNGVRGQNANYGNYAYNYNYPGRVEAPLEGPAA